MKFLIVEPSPLPILIPLGPKYNNNNDDDNNNNKVTNSMAYGTRRFNAAFTSLAMAFTLI